MTPRPPSRLASISIIVRPVGRRLDRCAVDDARRGAVTAGEVDHVTRPIRDLAGSTLGIIGLGVLGRAIADLGRAFGMKALFSDYKGTTGTGPLYTPFEQALRESDVITLHSPLMSSARNMISTDEFAMMARHPLLINTVRGGLVDEIALERALREEQISGAGVDVSRRTTAARSSADAAARPSELHSHPACCLG